MIDLTGKTIAKRYRVDLLIGRGGMGDVYKVWDSQRAVFLAMKVLHADLAEDKVFLRRFAREAETLSALQHPHIVRFYGLEQDGRLTFMLMDYVEGTTLRGKIFDTKEPFTLEQVLNIVRPICSALHYAHNQGRVHCDIKPANIMIKDNGDVLIADFGIARLMETSTTMTMAGAGTPAYMAPEQVLGKQPSSQTDIYALGIVLYEMLTGGERPFTGERAKIDGSTSEKVRWEQTNLQPPSPRKYNPSISPELESLILRCLEKDPTRRYASALELLQTTGLALGGAEETQDFRTETTQDKQSTDKVRIPLQNEFPSATKEKPKAFSRTKFVIIGLIMLVLASIIGLPSLIGKPEEPTPTITNTAVFITLTSIPPSSTKTPTLTITPTKLVTVTPVSKLIGRWTGQAEWSCNPPAWLTVFEFFTDKVMVSFTRDNRTDIAEGIWSLLGDTITIKFSVTTYIGTLSNDKMEGVMLGGGCDGAWSATKNK